MRVEKFKPNLIPNAPKDGSFNLLESLDKNDNVSNYMISLKKDGCRLQLGLGDKILTRALKEPQSDLVKAKFEALNKLCLKLNIAVDGEFYMHGAKFNEIFRFFANTNVSSSESVFKIQKTFAKDPIKFEKDFNGRSIEWLTTFHDELKFHIFDGIVIDRPEVVRFEDRIQIIYDRLKSADAE